MKKWFIGGGIAAILVVVAIIVGTKLYASQASSDIYDYGSAPDHRPRSRRRATLGPVTVAVSQFQVQALKAHEGDTTAEIGRAHV